MVSLSPRLLLNTFNNLFEDIPDSKKIVHHSKKKALDDLMSRTVAHIFLKLSASNRPCVSNRFQLYLCFQKVTIFYIEH